MMTTPASQSDLSTATLLSPAESIAELGRIIRQASDGDLEVRVLSIDRFGEFEPLAGGLNLLLDQVDAFVRESVGAMRATVEGRFHRVLLPRGLRGNFRQAAGAINDARQFMLEAADHERAQLSALTSHLDSEMRTSVDSVLDGFGNVNVAARTINEALEQTQSQATDIARQASDAQTAVAAVAAATEELNASASEVNGQVQRAARTAEEAVGRANDANQSMKMLDDAARKIAGFVGIISQISHQTRLLALNAQIEAARAGDAGRGFAVVASEVKTLATQTAQSTDDIRNQVNAIQTAVKESVGAMRQVAESIDSISVISKASAEAVDTQMVATAEISRNAQTAATSVNAAADQVGEIATESAKNAQLSQTIRDNSERSKDQLNTMRRRLNVLLRNQAAGNRRNRPRYVTAEPGTIEFDVHRTPISGELYNISANGLLFHPAVELSPDLVSQLRAGVSGAFKTAAIGAVSIRLTQVGELGLHAAFADLGEPGAIRARALTDRLKENDAPRIAAMAQAARGIGLAFEGAIKRQEISIEALFDEDYVAIPNTNPVQYRSQALALCDQVLPEPQNHIRANFPDIIFCAAVDRNGYLPTHNPEFAHPQSADPVWNAAHCRQRRIFNDPAGLSDARNTSEVLMQAYPRDLGGGRIVRMKSISVPIWVNGRHWGGLRAGMPIPPLPQTKG